MTYRVNTLPQAERDALEILDRLIAEHAGRAGLQWFLELEGAIASLTELPHRCPLARESEEFPFEVRQLLYGRRSNAYRILFTIEGDTVHVLHIRHSRRSPI